MSAYEGRSLARIPGCRGHPPNRCSQERLGQLVVAMLKIAREQFLLFYSTVMRRRVSATVVTYKARSLQARGMQTAIKARRRPGMLTCRFVRAHQVT